MVLNIFKKYTNPREILLQRVRTASEMNTVLVLLLRSDGTADLVLPLYVGHGVALIKSRGRYLVVPFAPDEVHRLPGRLPLVVAAEYSPAPLTAETVLWSQVARALSSANGSAAEVKTALARLAGERGLSVKVGDKVVPAAEILRGMHPSELLETLAGRGAIALPLDSKGLSRLVSPTLHMSHVARYYEAKAVDFMVKTLQLKLAYESDWAAILKKLLPLLALLGGLLVIVWLLPQVMHALSAAGGGGVVRIP